MQLKELYNIFARHKEGQWIIEAQNAIQLYDFVKEQSITRVLDLGTGIGCSAAIVAFALKEKGVDYHIDTVEHLDKCINLAKELIPKDLQEHITFHKSGVKFWQTDKIPYQYYSNYDTIPEGGYDLIINDGPPPILENDKWIEIPNGTVTEMLLSDKIKPKTIIVFDGRPESFNTLQRYFTDNFKLVKTPQQRFRVIRRQENPVLFKDEILEGMKQSSYFKDL